MKKKLSNGVSKLFKLRDFPFPFSDVNTELKTFSPTLTTKLHENSKSTLFLKSSEKEVTEQPAIM